MATSRYRLSRVPEAKRKKSVEEEMEWSPFGLRPAGILLFALHVAASAIVGISLIDPQSGFAAVQLPMGLRIFIPFLLPISALLLLSALPGALFSVLFLAVLGSLTVGVSIGRMSVSVGSEFLLAPVLLSLISALAIFLIQGRSRRLLRRTLSRSYRNPVSGLPNRYKLLEDVRHAEAPVLALVKAERFTEINSCFGYSFGEEYIRSITEVILGTLNRTLSFVSLYHVDRDTFAILQDNSRFGKVGTAFDERFSTIISLLRDQTFSISGLRFPVPVTAGIAVGKSGAGVLLYNQAEQALTAALYAGRSQMLFSDSEIVKDDIVTNTSTLAMVSHAIKSDLVEVHFQPIMRNHGSRIAMYEALVRLKTDEGELIPPGSFLFTTKLSSYHKELTRIVFEKTFKRMSGSELLFTVNISMENILDEHFLPLLEALMRKHRDCRDRCVLEITESEGVQNYRDVADFIEAVRDLGYKVAIDDFGSGYSNFANVVHLPVDYVKFDGSLIQGLLNDDRAEKVVGKMNEMAKSLNIRTIAEFVDSRELLTAVRRIRIDYSQGFLIGKPAARLAKTVELAG